MGSGILKIIISQHSRERCLNAKFFYFITFSELIYYVIMTVSIIYFLCLSVLFSFIGVATTGM